MDKSIKILQELSYLLLTDKEWLSKPELQQPILKMLLGIQTLIEHNRGK